MNDEAEDDVESDDSPEFDDYYCLCDLEPTMEELDTNICQHCGRHLTQSYGARPQAESKEEQSDD